MNLLLPPEITLRQVTYLLAVADAGSFTVAARRMHVSQPALSQQIKALETSLGGPLLDRPPAPVRLSAAGRAFAAEARSSLGGLHRAAAAAGAAMDADLRELRVATVRSLAVSPLPIVIQRWQTTHPGMTVFLREFAHRDSVAKAVLDGESELGVAPGARGWPGVRQRLGWDELVVVLPRNDPMLEQAGVPLEELAGRDWVLFEPGHGLAEIADWACRRAGFKPLGVAFTAQVEAAARLASAGVGPTLIPADTVAAELREQARPLAPRIVWGIDALAATNEWPPHSAELIATMAEAGWDAGRPPGSIEVRFDRATGLRSAPG